MFITSYKNSSIHTGEGSLIGICKIAVGLLVPISVITNMNIMTPTKRWTIIGLQWIAYSSLPGFTFAMNGGMFSLFCRKNTDETLERV